MDFTVRFRRPKSLKRGASFLRIFSLFLVLTSCGADYSTQSSSGKKAILDAANVELTRKNCAQALQLLQPLYKSNQVDSEVRLVTASAYGCVAGIDLFQLISDLSANSSRLSGASFWALLAQLFPSTSADRVVESAYYGTQALLATWKPGTIVLPSSQINAATANVGSLVASDRTADANAYLVFMSWAAIGGIENRYGNPNPTTFAKGNSLSWTTAATVDATGCQYASSIVNFIDGLGEVIPTFTGTIRNNLQSIQSAFQTVIHAACDIGCTNAAPGGGWVQSGCTVTTACASCPLGLRNPSQCLGVASDQVSCAAAGVVNFINNSPLGWQ